MTKRKLKMIDMKNKNMNIEDTSDKKETGDSPVPSLESRLQSAFSNDKIKVLLITERIYDPNTFEASQGIKLDVNSVEVKMRWSVETANQHQTATGISSEDIIYNAVVGALTAWGTCRMTIVK
jgi:hypothetical protein